MTKRKTSSKSTTSQPKHQKAFNKDKALETALEETWVKLRPEKEDNRFESRVDIIFSYDRTLTIHIGYKQAALASFKSKDKLFFYYDAQNPKVWLLEKVENDKDVKNESFVLYPAMFDWDKRFTIHVENFRLLDPPFRIVKAPHKIANNKITILAMERSEVFNEKGDEKWF